MLEGLLKKIGFDSYNTGYNRHPAYIGVCFIQLKQ